MRVFILLVFCISLLSAAEVTVTIKAGERAYQGHTYTWKATQLGITEPATKSETVQKKAPGTYREEFADRGSWPNWNKGHKPIDLKPETRDIDGTLMLGMLYRAVIPESVSITNKDGTRLKQGEDFIVNPLWGQVCALNDSMGAAGKAAITVTYQYRMQRLDLVQVDSKGNVSVKNGSEVILCPALPEPDPDHCPIAGIYVHPFAPEAGKAYSIPADFVCMINPPQEQPVFNQEFLKKSLALLQNGRDIKIALLGDSVTLGAEAGFWWEDRSQTWTGRLVVGLSERFPDAQIKEIPAYKGGITTKQGAEFFKKNVAPAKPDLLLIALGLNDAGGHPKKNAKVPAPVFKEAIRKMVVAAKESGSEVILVTPFHGNPWCVPGSRVHKHVEALKELAREENVACADVYTAWGQLRQRGIAPYSQVHNGINHPGSFGHSVYSDCILGLFGE